MEAVFLPTQMKLLRHFPGCAKLTKHACKKQLHILSTYSMLRSGKNWCRYQHGGNKILNNKDQLLASGFVLNNPPDIFPWHQQRDFNILSERHRFSKNGTLKCSPVLQNIPALQKTPASVTVQHRSVSYTKKILDASPPKIQPYLRLLRFDKPIGTYLLFWPCTWSIGLAAQAGHLPDLYLLALFGLGSFVMRGAGCIINDMWDRDIDKKVERTKTRPLASGELTPFRALLFLGGNLSIALTILLQLNWYSVYLGAASMILVVLYPLAKRYTYWPQVVLGVTLNWGVLVAWSAIKGSLTWPVVPLYTACVVYTMFYDTIYSHQVASLLVSVCTVALLCLKLDLSPLFSQIHNIFFYSEGKGDLIIYGLTFNYGAMLGWCAVKGELDWPIVSLYAGCLLWTLVYDTIYAHQDKYDDMLIGVKSTALKFGNQTKAWLTGFSSLMIGCLFSTGQMCEQTWPYYIALGATAAHLFNQLSTVDLDNPDDCLKKFKSNTQLGAILFFGIVLGNLLKPEKEDSEDKTVA